MDDKPFEDFLIDWSAFLGADEEDDGEAKRAALRAKILAGFKGAGGAPIQTGS